MYLSPLLVQGGPGGPPDADEFKHGLIGPVEFRTAETQYQNVHLLYSSVENMKMTAHSMYYMYIPQTVCLYNITTNEYHSPTNKQSFKKAKPQTVSGPGTKHSNVTYEWL